MRRRTYQELVRLVDDLKLTGEETVSQFQEALGEALGAYLPFPSGGWCMADIASAWCVVAVYDPEQDAHRFFQVTYSRADDGSFGFDNMVEVEREMTVAYEPIDPAAGETEGGAGMGAMDAVVSPTADQRSDLPNAAFAISIPRPNGLAPKRALPHHVNTVKKPNDDTTVDLPRLRSGLARIGQVEGATRAQLKAGLQHLEGHASRLKIGRFAKDAEDVEVLIGELLILIDGAEQRGEAPGFDWVPARVDAMTAEAIARRRVPASEATPPVPTLADKAKALGLEPFVDRIVHDLQLPATPRLLTDAQVRDKRYPTASPPTKAFPDGKPFLGVYTAGMTIMGRINANRYLYPALHVVDNVKRLCDAVQQAYGAPPDKPNMFVGQLIGEADHPTDGPRLAASCLMMLDFWIDGTDVSFAFGLMDTAAGRDMKALWDHGMPVATSMRSRGKGSLMEMGPDDAHWDLNQDQKGEPYLLISPLYIEANDLVVKPASWTYVEQQIDQLAEPATQQLLRDAVMRIRSGQQEIPGPVPTNDSAEDPMNKEALEALKAITTDQLRDSVPAAVLDAASPARAQLEVQLTDAKAQLDATKTQLTDAQAKLAEAQAARATLQTVVDAVEADRAKVALEKAELDRKAKIEDAIRAKCEGLPWSDARSKHLRSVLLANPAATAESVEGANKEFEDNFGSYLARTPEVPGGKTSPEGRDPNVVVNDKDTNEPFGALMFSRPPVV